MKVKNYIYLILLGLAIVPLCGCLAAYSAAVLGGHAANAIGGIEKKSINAAVSPGVTKEELSNIKKVALIFGDENPTNIQFGGSGLTEIMADNMALEMLKLGYECVEKEKLKKSLKEQGIEINGTLDLENALKAGKQLGIHAIVLGNVASSSSFKSSAGMFSANTSAGISIQNATLKIVGTEKGDTMMVVSINYKKGQNPDKAAQSMAQIMKAKLENPFEQETKK